MLGEIKNETFVRTFCDNARNFLKFIVNQNYRSKLSKSRRDIPSHLEETGGERRVARSLTQRASSIEMEDRMKISSSAQMPGAAQDFDV